MRSLNGIIPNITRDIASSYEKFFRNNVAEETIVRENTDNKLFLEGKLKENNVISDSNVHIGYLLEHAFLEGKLYRTSNKIIAGVNTIDIHEGYAQFTHNHIIDRFEAGYDVSTNAHPHVEKFINKSYDTLLTELVNQGVITKKG